MAEMNAPWMRVAQALNGEAEIAGKMANPRIVEMFRVTGCPDEPAFRSDETAWCAAFVNACLACSGFQGTRSALASTFSDFGTSLATTPEPGCVVLFHPLSEGASGHVAFYVGEDATTIRVLGGNQSNKVKEANFPKSKWRAYRWPSQTAPLPQTTLPTILTLAPGEAPDHVMSPDARVPASRPVIVPVATDNFARLQPIIDKWEGGYTDDPQDPGGATNRGITQEVLAAWRKHPVSKDDVRNLSLDEAHQIFRALYWSKLRCDEMPIAVALMTYNAGVNSGIGRGALWLQQSLNKQGFVLDADGEVGRFTLDACARANVDRVIDDYAGIQEAYLRGRATFAHFGAGWMNRLNDVKAKAKTMESEPVVIADTGVTEAAVTTTASGPAVTLAAPVPQLDSAFDIFSKILKETTMASTPAITNTTPSAGATDGAQRAADIAAMLAQLAKLMSGARPADGTKPAADTAQPDMPLSIIDKLLGGEALAGKKTMLAVFGYVIVGVLQILGQIGPALGAGATPTGQILTLLLTALGGLGATAKVDRLTQTLALVAAGTKK